MFLSVLPKAAGVSVLGKFPNGERKLYLPLRLNGSNEKENTMLMIANLDTEQVSLMVSSLEILYPDGNITILLTDPVRVADHWWKSHEVIGDVVRLTGSGGECHLKVIDPFGRAYGFEGEFKNVVIAVGEAPPEAFQLNERFYILTEKASK